MIANDEDAVTEFRYYDEYGELADVNEAAKNHQNRWRLKTQVGDVEVSTVHTGFPMSDWLDGPPLIFETMLFPQAEVVARYSTKGAAEIGHWRTVQVVKDGLPT